MNGMLLGPITGPVCLLLRPWNNGIMKSTASKSEVIDFSLETIQAGKRSLWPQMIARFCEEQEEGSGLEFAFQMYRDFLPDKNFSTTQEQLLARWLREFERVQTGSSGLSAEEVKDKSREIWYDQQVRSSAKRGISRLYDAHVFLHERNPSYIRSIIWALASLATDGGELDVRLAKKIVTRFSNYYP